MPDEVISEIKHEDVDEDQVWVIGSRNSHADESFLWTDDIQDVTDACILIIDLSAFPVMPAEHSQRVRPRIVLEPTPPFWVKQYVENWQTRVINNLKLRMASGGHVIFLLDSNHVSEFMVGIGLIPFGVKIIKLQERTIRDVTDNDFVKYLQYVEHVDYEIQIPSSVWGRSAESDPWLQYEHNAVRDNSDRLVAASYNVHRGWGNSGVITLLPPITTGTREQAIDAIIAVFKESVDESPPPWAESVAIPTVEEITRKIGDLSTKKAEIESEIAQLESEKGKLCKWHGLLYSNGRQLERIVRDAFIQLGLTETRRDRSSEKEDWLTEISSTSEVGVIEVKGHKTRAQMSDIDKCIRWAEDYEYDNPSSKVKGILVLNQLRLKPLSESIDERNRLESNQIRQAELRKVCIIPTCVLFDAVMRVLGGYSPNRDEIERAISGTNGLLESLF